MAFESAPNKDGIYRIKVLNQDFYLEAIPKSESAASTPWIRLAVADLSSQKQKVLCFVVAVRMPPRVLTLTTNVVGTEEGSRI